MVCSDRPPFPPHRGPNALRALCWPCLLGNVMLDGHTALSLNWAAHRLSAMTLFQALLPLPSLKEKHVPSTRVTQTCFTAAVLEGRAILWGLAMVTASEGLFFYWGHSGSGLKMSVCDSTVGNRHCHMFVCCFFFGRCAHALYVILSLFSFFPRPWLLLSESCLPFFSSSSADSSPDSLTNFK